MDLSLLESVPDAMVIADEQGTILHVNAVAERLFGWPHADIVGQPIEILLPARFRGMHQVHRAGYHAAPRTRPMGLGLDLSGLRRDGGEFAAEISLAPLAVDGRPCVIAAVRDVSERKRIEDKARLWRKARDEVRERDEFRMRLGRLELAFEPGDLSELARETVLQLHDEIERSGSRLLLDLAPTSGRFDRLRLEQVITNLLTNAAKFGRGKPITLHVAPDGERARIRVTDHGIGISTDDQSRVFERFERAVTSEHFGGLGLGLYIARQIVEAHGGEIRVESAPAAGTSFVVLLPREPARHEEPVEQRRGA